VSSGERPLSRRGLGRDVGLALALVGCLASACATAARFTTADTATVDHLLTLIRQRLEVAPEVARTKWNSRAPIEDPTREKQIVDDVAARAAEYGLDAHTARSFFGAQIAAGKTVQSGLHAQWTSNRQPPFARVADLGTDIRPTLDRLTPLMMRALADARPVLERRGSDRLLALESKTVLANAPGGDAAVRQAVAPLLTFHR